MRPEAGRLRLENFWYRPSLSDGSQRHALIEMLRDAQVALVDRFRDVDMGQEVLSPGAISVFIVVEAFDLAQNEAEKSLQCPCSLSLILDQAQRAKQARA